MNPHSTLWKASNYTPDPSTVMDWVKAVVGAVVFFVVLNVVGG